MRSPLQNYGWLLVVAVVVAVYAWGPLWPHALRRLPQWPWSATFTIVLVLTAFYLRRHLSVGPIFLGAAVIAMYLYLEDMVAPLALEATRGRLLIAITHDLTAYLVLPVWYVLVNLPVVVTFALLELVIGRLDRWSRPVTVEQ